MAICCKPEIFLVWFVVAFSQEMSQSVAANTVEFILDQKIGSLYPWSLPSENHEEYFHYYDNLTSYGLTEFAKDYFEDKDLSNLELAQGIWVAYYAKPSSIFNQIYPKLQLPTSLTYESVEITYCIYVQGTIRVEGAEIEKVLKNGEMDLTWKTFTANFISNQFQLLLMPNQEGDFVLIDKITVKAKQMSELDIPTSRNNMDQNTFDLSSSSKILMESSLLSNNASNEPESAQYTILDFKNEAATPWDLSTLDYEDWFFYYDNLAAESLTEFSTNYFTNVTLTNLESAQGIWTSFQSEIPPIFGEEFPSIKLGVIQHEFEIVEITYYIHGTGNITIINENETRTISRSETMEWETFSAEFSSRELKVWLMPNETGDFILIDKVILRDRDAIIPTTTTVSEIDKEYILDTTEQTESSPWTVSELLPNQFDYFENLENESISDFANDYFESHNIRLDQLQLPTIQGIWAAFYSISSESFPQISLSEEVFEILTLNFYIHQNASIRIAFRDPEQCLEFRQENSSSIPSWQRNVTLMSAVDGVTLELRTNTDGDFILIDKVIASQCTLNDQCKTATETISSSTLPDTTETFETTEDLEISSENTETSTSSTTFKSSGDESNNANNLNDRFIWVCTLVLVALHVVEQ